MAGERDASLDQLRGGVLDRIARSERNATLFLIGAAVVEALFLGGFALLADFHNRVHVLIFLSTIAIYSILGLGLMALRAFMQRQTLLVLQAVDGMRDDGA